VISFGAGSDTRFFRLLQAHPHLADEFVYHEIDFPDITSQKISAILKGHEAEKMLSLIGRERITAVDEGAGLLRSTVYNIHPLDLRKLKPGCEMPSGIDPSLPTLFLSECCLIYLGPEEADGILKWVTEAFRGAVGIVLYEPIGGDDAFGKVMIQNLAARGIVLKTLKKYSTLSKQKMRLKMLGFGSGQEAVDVEFTYENWVEGGEKERIASLQMLDEVEEWQLLARHYCIAWGWKGPEFEVWRGKFPLQVVEE
jgi:[phosphatase 2A protein]-leucine-carboxy methyltransferase